MESSDVGAIMSSYNSLISMIRQWRNNVIVMSAIIPRPVDHQVTGDKVKTINKKIHQWCRDMKVQH